LPCPEINFSPVFLFSFSCNKILNGLRIHCTRVKFRLDS
jgi:hypothetical protein